MVCPSYFIFNRCLHFSGPEIAFSSIKAIIQETFHASFVWSCLCFFPFGFSCCRNARSKTMNLFSCILLKQLLSTFLYSYSHESFLHQLVHCWWPFKRHFFYQQLNHVNSSHSLQRTLKEERLADEKSQVCGI